MKTPLSANLVALEPKTRSSSLFLFFLKEELLFAPFCFCLN